MSFSGRNDRIWKQEVYFFLQARATPVVVSSLYPLLHSFLSLLLAHGCVCVCAAGCFCQESLTALVAMNQQAHDWITGVTPAHEEPVLLTHGQGPVRLD